MGLIVVDEKKNKLVEVIGSEKKLLGELCIHSSMDMYHWSKLLCSLIAQTKLIYNNYTTFENCAKQQYLRLAQFSLSYCIVQSSNHVMQ